MNLLFKLMMRSGVAEAVETFLLNLSNPVNATILDGQGVGTINNVGSLFINASLTRTSGVAPLGVHVDASASLALVTVAPLAFSDLDYIVDFGDGSVATWQQGTYPNAHSKNIAYGPISAHVYETAGTYTVNITVEGFDSSGTRFSKSQTVGTVTVAAETTLSTVYAGKVLPVAGAGGVPGGANVALATTWADVIALTSTYKRIMLRGGDVWDTAAAGTISAAGPGMFGRYGTASPTGPRMVANAAAFNLGSTAKDWRFVDLAITSDGVEANAKIAFVGSQSDNMTVLRCNITNVHFGLSTVEVTGLYLVDSTIDGTFFADFGIGAYLDDTINLAVMGTLVQNVIHNHGFRCQGLRKSVVSNSTFKASDGSSLTIRGVTKGGNATPWSGLWTEKNVVSDCVLGPTTSNTGEGFYSGPQSTGHAERCRDLLFERNFVTNNILMAAWFRYSSGLCVRQCVFTTKYTYGVLISMDGNATGSPEMTEGSFYNNTIYKLDNTISTAFSGIYVPNSGVPSMGFGLKINNILCYAPGSTMDGATNGTQASIAVFQGVAGVNYTIANTSSTAQINGTRPWDATSPITVDDYTPNSGSYAIGAGVFKPVKRDIKRVSIGTNYTLGAIKV